MGRRYISLKMIHCRGRKKNITFESQLRFWPPLERSHMGLGSNSTGIKSHQNYFISYSYNDDDGNEDKILVSTCWQVFTGLYLLIQSDWYLLVSACWSAYSGICWLVFAGRYLLLGICYLVVAGWNPLVCICSLVFAVLYFLLGVFWLVSVSWYLLFHIFWVFVGIYWLAFACWYLLRSFLAHWFFNLQPLPVLDQVPLLQLVSVLVQLVWHPEPQLLKEILNDSLRIIKFVEPCNLSPAITQSWLDSSFFLQCLRVNRGSHVHVLYCQQENGSPSNENFSFNLTSRGGSGTQGAPSLIRSQLLWSISTGNWR